VRSGEEAFDVFLRCRLTWIAYRPYVLVTVLTYSSITRYTLILGDVEGLAVSFRIDLTQALLFRIRDTQ